MTIYLVRKAQITFFITKKVIVLVKYLDFAEVFSKKLAKMLLKCIAINKHAINLEKGNQ